MSRSILFHHKNTPCLVIDSLICATERLNSGDLQLSYHLQGDLKKLLIPAQKKADQTDNLWLHTCFEAFIAIAGDKDYYEFNFSPSKQWAAYKFNDYRERSDWDIMQAPEIDCIQQKNSLIMNIILPASTLPKESASRSLELGLSAVIESKNGNISYWALSHSRDQPDFHCRESFNLTINHPLHRETL